MEQLPNGFQLELPEGCFPLSTDSMVLSHFVKLPKNARVLDLGSGCGTLGLLLCAADPSCSVTGVELTEIAHAAALNNIAANGLDSRMESICADLRALPPQIAPGSFSVCLSNPPYFSGGPSSREHPLARQDSCCGPEDLMKAASIGLKYGGDFFLVHKPEKLAQLIACGAKEGLEAKQLLLLRHREDGPISLICLAFRKGGKPGLKIREAALFGRNGTPTPYYRTIYHLE